MAAFLGAPKVQFFATSTGAFLSGGLLYTYEAGTTTNKATYPTVADSLALTNANTNPVVLDSRGEANVVLKGATKLVLKDSAGSTIWTVDNVNTVATDISDENGNELLKFTATTSAVNELTITNAVTGTKPVLSASGGDTNIDLGLTPKGSGVVAVTGSETVSGSLTVSGAITLAGSTVYANQISAVITTYTTGTAATHTFNAKNKFATVELVGGGGGSGGITGTSGSFYIGSGGGGAGTYARRTFTAAQCGATATYSVGAAGAAGTAGTVGGAGGNTTFALVGSGTITMTAPGGSGGAGGTGASDPLVCAGGAGGTAATNAEVAVTGESGGAGISVTLAVGGAGGSTRFGGGGKATGTYNGGPTVGAAGTGYGAGGGGSYASAAATNTALGAAGTGGLIIVTEYCDG